MPIYDVGDQFVWRLMTSRGSLRPFDRERVIYCCHRSKNNPIPDSSSPYRTYAPEPKITQYAVWNVQEKHNDPNGSEFETIGSGLQISTIFVVNTIAYSLHWLTTYNSLLYSAPATVLLWQRHLNHAHSFIHSFKPRNVFIGQSRSPNIYVRYDFLLVC